MVEPESGSRRGRCEAGAPAACSALSRQESAGNTLTAKAMIRKALQERSVRRRAFVYVICLC
jgi:hypothetical protein